MCYGVGVGDGDVVVIKSPACLARPLFSSISHHFRQGQGQGQGGSRTTVGQAKTPIFDPRIHVLLAQRPNTNARVGSRCRVLHPASWHSPERAAHKYRVIWRRVIHKIRWHRLYLHFALPDVVERGAWRLRRGVPCW